MKIDLEYVFSIEATLETRVVGEVPGGVRIDVGYKDDGVISVKAGHLPKIGGVVRMTKNSPDNDDQEIGEISSGQDWILIGKVGEKAFADLDGRLTFRFFSNENPKETDTANDVTLVAGGHVRGRVDLDVSYQDWMLGDLTKPLALVVPLSFDVSAVGDKKTSPAQKNAVLGHAPIAELSRSLFWGIGTASVKSERYSPLTKVSLDVYRSNAPAAVTASDEYVARVGQPREATETGHECEGGDEGRREEDAKKEQEVQ